MDAMLDSMTAEQWREWIARDSIEPINHEARMLGYIAHGLSVFFKSEASSDQLRQAFTPWIEKDEEPMAGVKPDSVRRLASRLGI